MLENQEQTRTLSVAELLDLLQTESVQLLDVVTQKNLHLAI